MSAAAAAMQPGSGAIADFTAGVMPHLPFLQRLALKLTGNVYDAEDLVQDLMLKLLQQPERLLGIGALKPWLARVLHHQHIDQFRRRPPAQAFISFEQTVDDEVGQELLLGLADDGAGPEEEMRDEQLRRQLAAALRGLPEITRRLVELHEIEGQSLPALAEFSGIPLNTIKDHLKRARQYLRARLNGPAEEVEPEASQSDIAQHGIHARPLRPAHAGESHAGYRARRNAPVRPSARAAA